MGCLDNCLLGTLELNYSPDEAYTLRARASVWPTAFTGSGASTQTSDLQEKDDLLIALSVNWLYQSLGNYERSGRWWTTFMNMLKSSVMEEHERPDLTITPGTSADSLSEYWKDPFTQVNP